MRLDAPVYCAEAALPRHSNAAKLAVIALIEILMTLSLHEMGRRSVDAYHALREFDFDPPTIHCFGGSR